MYHASNILNALHLLFKKVILMYYASYAYRLIYVPNIISYIFNHKLRINAVLLLVLLSPFRLIAQDLKPPIILADLPIQDQQVMLALHDDNLQSWSIMNLSRSDTGHLVKQFSEKLVWIFYGVKPTQNKTGAISVKVTRFFKNVKDDEVYLYRNKKFFNASGKILGSYEPEDGMNKVHYYDFHKENKISSVLKNKFHARWNESHNSFTANNLLRKSFLFKDNAKDAVSRSYLLHYDTTPNGSWIDFNIGTGGRHVNQLERIEIIITDLNSERRDTEIERILIKKP